MKLKENVSIKQRVKNILKLAIYYQVKPVSDMFMCYAVIKQSIEPQTAATR